MVHRFNAQRFKSLNFYGPLLSHESHGRLTHKNKTKNEKFMKWNFSLQKMKNQAKIFCREMNPYAIYLVFSLWIGYKNFLVLLKFSVKISLKIFINKNWILKNAINITKITSKLQTKFWLKNQILEFAKNLFESQKGC